MKLAKKPDLLHCSLWKSMLIFSIPLIITNLLQAIYNIVDMIIVGQFAGATDLAAVGNGGQVTMLILAIVMGLSNGGVVITAQLLGAKKSHQISDVMGTMCVAFDPGRPSDRRGIYACNPKLCDHQCLCGPLCC